jgi:hypothetical protein
MKRKFEIGRILHLKSEIRNLKLDCGTVLRPVQSAISDLGFEMQDSSDFKMFRSLVEDQDVLPRKKFNRAFKLKS